MIKKLIQKHFGLDVQDLQLLADHFDRKIYLAQTQAGDFVIKTFDEPQQNVETEGAVTQYLANHGIRVAQLRRSDSGRYLVGADGLYISVQPFFQGDILPLNGALDWYLERSAELLGQIHAVLRDYPRLPVLFDEAFLSRELLMMKQAEYDALLGQDAIALDKEAVRLLTARKQHLDKLAMVDFDLSRLTRCNSHADFYINQTLVNGHELTVIDWTDASYVPVCFETIMSYTYADPACKEGVIDIDRLCSYLRNYMRHAPLSRYDLEMMPHFYFFQLSTCCFTPPYDDLPEDYLRIALLCDKLMAWLYENADKLSVELVRRLG